MAMSQKQVTNRQFIAFLVVWTCIESNEKLIKSI